MTFLYIDDDDEEVYDSRESALERARNLAKGLPIFEQRSTCPDWFAVLVRYTPFRFIAYRKTE